jgi:hypothetical protein
MSASTPPLSSSISPLTPAPLSPGARDFHSLSRARAARETRRRQLSLPRWKDRPAIVASSCCRTRQGGLWPPRSRVSALRRQRAPIGAGHETGYDVRRNRCAQRRTSLSRC